MLNGGVIVWNQQLLVYRRAAAGWHAQYLGDDHPLAVAGELLAAIEADQQRQQQKRLSDAAD
ncbi:MAG: hypothetical protein JWR16_1077 [Nevskia sp.]|nr:hypothetical protein [Nevskia sp.]